MNNSNIQNKLDSLETQMNRIENKLDKLLKDFEILNELEPQCKKMSDHIDFVENVYDKVKSPMYYILNKISQIRNITNRDENIDENMNRNRNKLLDK
jgi:DNA repair exonuclease SbcCD ATPase subunit